MKKSKNRQPLIEGARKELVKRLKPSERPSSGPPAPTPAAELAFNVQAKLCATCIYRPDSPLDLAKLEADVADPNMEGFFRAYRECHHAKRGSKICCRGFWNAHKDDFTAGQIAQRLNIVRFVNVDVMPDSTEMVKQNRRMRRAQASRNDRAK